MSERMLLLVLVFSLGGCLNWGVEEPEGDGDADSDGNADGDTDLDVEPHGDADGDADQDAEPDGDADSDIDADLDVDEDGEGGGDADVDVDVDVDGDGDGDGVASTLVVTCDAELSGRAIVDWNTNLGISFTDNAPTYSVRGSISFEFPPGFTGVVDNPENYEPGGPRHVVAVTDRSFTLHGNHCWEDGTPPRTGSGFIEEWRPNEGVVRATFTDFPLQNCVIGSAPCSITGTIETTGEGVFE